MPQPFYWFLYLLFGVLVFVVVLWALRQLGVGI
jgi:hypothetical protein